MAKKITSIFLRLVTLLAFVLVCGVTLFFAYGYQFDVKNRDVVKYSIIDLTADEKDLKVFLDNKEESTASLPFQIKNVEPGFHTVTVKKEGFLPWGRKVEVESDFVTIVNDIFLVPEKIEKFDTFVKSFDDVEHLYSGKDTLAVLVPGSKNLRLVTFYNNGTYKDEELELFNENIESVQLLEREKMFLAFDKDKYAWIDFSSQKIDFFTLPAEALNIKVNEPNKNVYFLLKNTFYRVPFGSTKINDEDFLSFKVRDDVQDYAFDLNGDFYFISKGMVFKANERGTEVEVIDWHPDKYVNLAFKKGKDYGTLILRDKDGKRALYLADKAGTLKFLEKQLKGQPYFNNFDQLIFSNTNGEVFFYDPRTLGKKIVNKMEESQELIGWFSDVGHFLLKTSDSLIMKDVFNGNSYKLLENKRPDQFFILNKALFYLEGKRLSRLFWES